MSQNNNKNYTRLLKKFDFTIPNFVKLPRAPDLFSNRDLVDVYTAKKRLQLAHLLPSLDNETLRLRATRSVSEFGSGKNLNRQYFSSLLASGYSDVVDEVLSLKREEDSLIADSHETGRDQSFIENKTLVHTLVEGLIACAQAEKLESIREKVFARQSLAEKMVLLEDYWLARKMLIRALAYLEYYDDEELDKMRVELWILMAFICIYHVDSQEVGYNLPTSYLSLAREISRDKPWNLKKTVMNIFIPKSTNVYGLRNDWFRVRSDRAPMHTVASTLLHVLCVKKAKYWQRELLVLEKNDGCPGKDDEQKEILKRNILEELTCALAYADELRQFPSFISITLRRGIYLEAQGEYEKAMEDFNAMHVLAGNYDDRESSAMALNRMGHATKVLKKNAVQTMDYFAREWELSDANGFEELKADALKDLGSMLLEEGYTWGADECVSRANEIFCKTRQVDTPNDNDDLTWAMMGVAKGQHLWGRFSTLIRTQERRNLRAVNRWKDGRNELPLALMPEKWYKPQNCSGFVHHYKIPQNQRRSSELKAASVEDVKREFSFSAFSRARFVNQSHVKLQFKIDEEDTTRRLFEFSSTDVTSRDKSQSVWLLDKGFENIFDFINASKKPRIEPRFFDSTDNDENWLKQDVEQMKEAAEDEASLLQRRKTEAIRRATSIGRSLKISFNSRTSSIIDRKLFKDINDRNARLSDTLDPLRDYIDTQVVKYSGSKSFSAPREGEAEDESEDSELFRRSVPAESRSKMSEDLRKELENFDEKSAIF